MTKDHLELYFLFKKHTLIFALNFMFNLKIYWLMLKVPVTEDVDNVNSKGDWKLRMTK